MPYNPSSDFVGLWRSISGGVEKAEMPGLDFVVQALARAGLLRVVTSQTAPTTNQSTTAWFQPANPDFGSEGTLFLWDPTLNMYVPATPELFHGGSTGGGGGGDGGSGDADMAIISGTAPSNPAVGQQWWDGTTMHIWDGNAWQATGSGSTALTFSISQPTTMTLTVNSWTIVPLIATPTIDVGGGWDPITKKYTPKRAGYYAFQARGIPSISAGGVGAVAIAKNDDGALDDNPAASDIVIAVQSIDRPIWNSCTGFAQMNGTTDYVRYFAYSTNGQMIAAGSNPVFTALFIP